MTPDKVPATQELTYALTVWDAMCKNVISVQPHTKIHTLRLILKEKKISGAPVVSDGILVGIISLEDLIKCFVYGELGATIEDKMTKDVTVCHPDDLLVRAIQILDRTGYGRLPVVERESGKLMGILTKGDVAVCLLKKLEELYDQREDNLESQVVALYKEFKGNYRFYSQAEILPKDFAKAGSASSGFRDSLIKLGIPLAYVRKAAICSYEAEMNMVIYSNGGNMELEADRKKIVLRAADVGPGIKDIKKAMTQGYSTAPDWVRELGFGAGMGLPNMKNNADVFRIRSKIDGPTKLYIEVTLP
jgi:CBS domain-containing protein/anti-sigma regulatory factor (Ser/Thr protein kinase)